MTLEDSARVQVAALQKTLTGKEAIYREAMIVVRVRVQKMVVNKWGARVRADVVASRGLVGASGSFEFSGAWQVLSVSAMSIAAAHVGWSLHWRPELVADILALGETLPIGDDHVRDNYLKLSGRIEEWRNRAPA